jgi:hypothetical protein
MRTDFPHPTPLTCRCDREAVYRCWAPDVEWVTPKRTLRGIDEIGKELTWDSPPEKLDLEFEAGDWVDLGDRRVACDVHQATGGKGQAKSPTNATGGSN